MSTDIPHDPTPETPPSDLPMIPLPEPASDMPMISLPDVSEQRVAPEAPTASEEEEMTVAEFEQRIDAMVVEAEAKVVPIHETERKIEDLLVHATVPLSDADDRIRSFGAKADAALDRLHRAAEEARASARPDEARGDASFDALDDAAAGREAAWEEGEPDRALGTHATEVLENAAIASAIIDALERMGADDDASHRATAEALAEVAGIPPEAAAHMLARQQERLRDFATADVDSAAKWKGIAKVIGKGAVYGGVGLGLNIVMPGMGAAALLGVARLTEAYIGGKRYERAQRDEKATAEEQRRDAIDKRFQKRITAITSGEAADDRQSVMENIAALIAVAQQRARDGLPPLDGDLTPDAAAEAVGAYAAERSSELTPEQREAMERATRAEVTTAETAAAAEAELVAARPALQKLRERMGKAMDVAGVVLRGGPTAKERVLTVAVFAGAGLLARESVVVRSVLLSYSGAKIGELIGGAAAQKLGASERVQKIAKRVGLGVGAVAGAALGILGFSRERAHAAEATGAPAEAPPPASRGVPPIAADTGGAVAGMEVPPRGGGMPPAEAPGDAAAPAEAAPIGTPEGAHALGIPEDQYELAKFDKGEGFTHPIYDQLRADPERFGFDPTSGRSVDAWAMAETKRIAIDYGFLAEDGVTTTHAIEPHGDVRVVVGVGADGHPNARVVGDYEKVPYHHVAGAHEVPAVAVPPEEPSTVVESWGGALSPVEGSPDTFALGTTGVMLDAPSLHQLRSIPFRVFAELPRDTFYENVRPTHDAIHRFVDAYPPGTFNRFPGTVQDFLKAHPEIVGGEKSAVSVAEESVPISTPPLEMEEPPPEFPSTDLPPEAPPPAPLVEPPPPYEPPPPLPPPEVILEPESGQPGGSLPEAPPEVEPLSPPAPEVPPAVGHLFNEDFARDFIAGDPARKAELLRTHLETISGPPTNKLHELQELIQPGQRVGLHGSVGDTFIENRGGTLVMKYGAMDQPLTIRNVAIFLKRLQA